MNIKIIETNNFDGIKLFCIYNNNLLIYQSERHLDENEVEELFPKLKNFILVLNSKLRNLSEIVKVFFIEKDTIKINVNNKLFFSKKVDINECEVINDLTNLNTNLDDLVECIDKLVIVDMYKVDKVASLIKMEKPVTKKPVTKKPVNNNPINKSVNNSHDIRVETYYEYFDIDEEHDIDEEYPEFFNVKNKFFNAKNKK